MYLLDAPYQEHVLPELVLLCILAALGSIAMHSNVTAAAETPFTFNEL